MYRDAYFNRGASYDSLKEFLNAVNDYTKVIEIDPKMSTAFLNRGGIFNELKKYENAIQDFTTTMIF